MICDETSLFVISIAEAVMTGVTISAVVLSSEPSMIGITVIVLLLLLLLLLQIVRMFMIL